MSDRGRTSGLSGVVLLRRLELNLIPKRRDLPPLPFSPPDQIAMKSKRPDQADSHRPKGDLWLVVFILD
jgi:hypothetical protein